MKIRSLLAVLVGLAIIAIGVDILFDPGPPEEPPNSAVNEFTYDRLRLGMTQGDIQELLGLPHVTCGGEVVKVDTPGSAQLAYSIEPGEICTGGDLLNIYRGTDDENIRVLFSGEDRLVKAVEYCVADKSVLYRGASSLQSRTQLGMLPRAVSLTPEQDANLKKLERRLTLRERIVTDSRPSLPPPSPEVASGTSLGKSLPSDSSWPASPSDAPPTSTPALPKQDNAEPPRSTQPLDAEKVHIKLPTGDELSEVMLELPQGWQGSMFPSGCSVYQDKYPNNALRGVFLLDSGKLEGSAATFYLDGQLTTLANYHEGQLTGPLRLWDEHQKRILFAEFKSDKKHGLVCFFREGRPWLIQKCVFGVVKEQYLVRHQEGAPTATPVSQLRGEDSKEATEAEERLADLEKDLSENEAQLKRGLTQWYRDETERLRRERFISGASQRREAGRQREAMRRMEQAAEVEGFWRSVLMRSWRWPR